MVTRETICEQFEALGSVPSDIVLSKCVEICANYGIDDPEQFVEQWMAFSISNLGGAEPTLEYLKQMERKELKRNENVKETKIIPVDSFPPHELSLTKEILSYNSYVNDLDNSQIKDDIEYKPGAVVCTYGKLNSKVTTWLNKNLKYNVELQIVPNKKGEYLDNNALYMFDNLADKCNIIGDHMYITGLQLCDKYLNNSSQTNASDSTIANTSNAQNTTHYSKSTSNDYSELSFVNASGQDIKKSIGRIVCDADGRLNPSSVMVHSTDDQALRKCHLNFNNLHSYDLYPGQTCMINGVNPRGDTIYVSDIKSELSSIMPNSSQITVTEGPLHIFIASGPFTSPDNLKYEPFKNIISYVKKHQPQVIILLGPFIDSQHELIVEGSLNVNFNDFVETLLTDLMEAIENPTSKIIIVSSSKDAISAEVFPTPPYKLFNGLNKPHLMLLPDPCTINILGILFTLTSTDVVRHMQEEELVHNAGRDIVRRCIRRIFSTRNMYPIYPPSNDVSLDTQLWSQFCEIDSIPHIMVLPSDNKYYIRDIDGCIIINPGRMVNENSGTFTRLEIHPSVGTNNLIERLACQTIKV
ncbi:DNA polymerase alpha subunit B [Ctenocephalides felis]|uniref:DNA polymerase alpha subunit B n=1 Tax=Ctenocephalides felis TaxID=7515 RepID=UPI000E6E498C|nr:DNA polymerase alpha subunit B [Ctenocephalides felis]